MITKKTARATIEAYLAGWQTADKQSWLALFCDDATLIDPVGTPAHTGKQAIGAFWDRVRSTGMAMHPKLHRVVVCGTEAVASFTMTSTTVTGMGMAVDIVDIFTLNDDGKIIELKAYWDDKCTSMVSP